MFTQNQSESVYEDSEHESDVVDELMSLLDNVKTHNFDKHETRDNLPATIDFQNFNLGENGFKNFRDGTVLGKPPGILIPNSLRLYDSILLSIWLHVDYDTMQTEACRVTAPVFCNEGMKTAHGELQHDHKTDTNQLWLQTSTLGDDYTVFFKKRLWQLSRQYRKVSGTQWPKFVITATPRINGELFPDKAVRTLPFEVRSKEQSNKTAASRGLSTGTKTKRRRTPQTEKASKALHKIQANIVQIRSQILNGKKLRDDFETRIRFMIAISETDTEFRQLHKSMVSSFTTVQQQIHQRK